MIAAGGAAHEAAQGRCPAPAHSSTALWRDSGCERGRQRGAPAPPPAPAPAACPARTVVLPSGGSPPPVKGVPIQSLSPGWTTAPAKGGRASASAAKTAYAQYHRIARRGGPLPGGGKGAGRARAPE